MTHSKTKSMTRAIMGALGKGAAVSLVAVPFAFGQTTTSEPAAPATPQKVEKIEITGSNIKRVDAETASPVEVITADEIKKKGATTVAEMLRGLPIANAGSLNDLATSSSFAIGSSSISLRGLGAQATLILLNGRRLASYGFANGGQVQFVNLDTIPVNAVERIEIVKDGASAIYGTEAMAGVINIILRKDFTGIELGGNFSQNRDSEYRIRRLNAAAGYGDLGRDRYNVMLTFDNYKRDNVFFHDTDAFLQRPGYGVTQGIGTAFSSNTFPGNYRNPATSGSLGYVLPCTGGPQTATSCTFDQYANISIVPKAERNTVFAKGTIDFNANLQGFAEVSYSKNKTEFSSAPSLLNEVGTSWFNLSTLGLNFLNLVFPVGNPNNPFSSPVGYRHRFLELGPTLTDVTTDATRFLAGLKGNVGAWDWESAYLYSGSNTTSTYHGQLRASTLAAAIANGTYNFISPSLTANSQALMSSISPAVSNIGDSHFSSIDFKASRELMQMRGGPLAVAVGGEYRREYLNSQPDALFQSSDIIGFGASSASGSRNVISAYGELSIPFLTNVESQVAMRTDHYSDYGSSTTPKVGIKWKVLPNFAVRATYAEGFRAPALPEISKSLSAGFYNGFQDTIRCAALGSAAPDCSESVPVLFGANPGLRAEKSKSDTVGFVWDATKDFSVTLDYYRIDRTGEIALLDPNFLILHASQFPGYVTRGPNLPGDPAGVPGPLVSFNSRYQNLGETIVTGEDLEMKYNLDLGAYGKITTRWTANYVNSYLNSATQSDPLVQYNGTYNQPRFRAYGVMSWLYRDWTVSPSVNYVGQFKFIGSPYDVCPFDGTSNASFCTVKPWTTFDLYIANNSIKDLTLALQIHNLANKQPPFDYESGTRMYNGTYHDPYGQYYTVSATYRFK